MNENKWNHLNFSFLLYIQLPVGHQNLGVRFSLVVQATQESHLFLELPVEL